MESLGQFKFGILISLVYMRGLLGDQYGCQKEHWQTQTSHTIVGQPKSA